MMNCSCDPSNMKYGQIAGNKHINTCIYRCFEYVCEKDERKFLKEFSQQPHDSDQIMHTVRELVLGAYLASSGLKVRHHYRVDNKTPEWCVLDDKSAVIGIVELTNFHIDKVTENQIEHQWQARGEAWVWLDPKNVKRLYDHIEAKAGVYSNLVKKLEVPYVIAVFCDFRAPLSFTEEVRFCLSNQHSGPFKIYPEISGLLYFEDHASRYFFNYAHNPSPLRRFDLPSGVFPPEAV